MTAVIAFHQKLLVIIVLTVSTDISFCRVLFSCLLVHQSFRTELFSVDKI